MSDVNIQISNDVVKGIIEKKLQTAVASAMVGQDQLVEGLVARCLAIKVDSEGKKNSYESYNKYDLIEWMCREAILKAANECIKSWVENSKPAIAASVERQLKASTKNLAAQFVNSLTSAAKDPWKICFDLSVKPQ